MSAFLIDKKYHFHRHACVQLFVLLMAVEFLFDTPDKLDLSINRLYRSAGYFLILDSLIYINSYLLVPRYLITNKFSRYAIAVFTLVLVMMVLFVIITLQLYIYDLTTVASSGDGTVFWNSYIDLLTGKDPSAGEKLLSFMNEASDQFFAIFLALCASILSIGLICAGSSTLSLFKKWMIDQQKASDLISANLDLELQFLKNQINPHFLFNMLNNANIMVAEDPDTASEILMKLNDFLHYQINDSAKDKVPLKADIVFLSDFLDLEKTRRDQFDYTVSKDGDLEHIEVAPLLFIPFVENAVKHNHDSEKLSYIHLSFKTQNNKLYFVCENSKPAKPKERKIGGLGLANIQRRLDLLYHYELKQTETDTSYTVHLTLDL